MESETFQAVAKYTGLGGVTALVLLFVYRAIISKVPRLSGEHALSVLRWIIVAVFLVTLAGISAYVYIAKPPAEKTRLIYHGSVNAAADKQPIEGAEAIVVGRDIGPRTSNKQGSFTFELPAIAGKFQGTIRVSHPAYESDEQHIEVSDETTGKPFLLKPNPPPEREWRGEIRDADGGVAAGVTVTIEDTTATAQTDMKGRFTLKFRTQQVANFILRVERDGTLLWRDFRAPDQHILVYLPKTK